MTNERRKSNSVLDFFQKIKLRHNFCYFFVNIKFDSMKRLFTIIAIASLFVSCVKTKGDVVLTYDRAQAVYGDLDSLRSLPLLIAKQPLENPKSFFISKDYILVGERNKGIHIYDNIDMQNPQRMSFIQIPNNKEFYVKDNFLYAETLYDFIKIDITDVYNPILVSRAKNVFWETQYDDKGRALIMFYFERITESFEVNSPEAKTIKKEGKLFLDYNKNIIPESLIPTSFTGAHANGKGTLNRISVDYGHIYVISDDKLHIIENGTEISKVGEKNLSDGSETIYAADNRLYIGSTTDLTIFNANNASNPFRLSTLEHTESCDPVLPHGNVAYYTLRSSSNEGCNELGENTLNVVDLSNELEPNVIESIELESPYGMTMVIDYLLVGQGANGLTIFDASNPTKLEKVAQIFNVEAFDVMLHPVYSNILIVSNSTGLQQFQVNWAALHFSPLGQIVYN